MSWRIDRGRNGRGRTFPAQAGKARLRRISAFSEYAAWPVDELAVESDFGGALVSRRIMNAIVPAPGHRTVRLPSLLGDLR